MTKTQGKLEKSFEASDYNYQSTNELIVRFHIKIAEAKAEFPDFEKLKDHYASVNRTGIDISATKAFQMDVADWFKKWFGEAK
jgi:cell fate (sporulation/competence/biofilm development) regulator YlbF (YheA/YmcA/DUF963 family)